MNPCRSLRRIFARYAPVGVAVLLVFVSPHANAKQQQSSEQQPNPQPPPQPPPQPRDPSAPKPKKIWTNDDVITLRSPADNYLVEKEAQAAADAEAEARRAALAKQIKDAGLTIKLPSTRGETERAIRAKEEQIKGLEDGVDRLTKDLPDVPEEEKPAKEKQLETITANHERAQLELKVLQDHLKNFPTPKPSESPAPPVAPPDPENPK